MFASQRGVSLLAALVLVGLLGVAAVGLSASSSSNPSALTAQATAPTTPPSPSVDKSKVSLACPKQGAQFIADTATANKQPCICQKQVNGVTKNYNVTYSVTGDVQKGKFVSVVTAKKVEEVGASRASCRVYDCPKGVNDLNKCTELKNINLKGTDFDRANSDLEAVLSKETERVAAETPKSLADELMRNPGAKLPPLSQGSLDQINSALEEKKQEGFFSDPNDALKAKTAQEALKNFAACGEEVCLEGGSDYKGETPADIDKALGDKKYLEDVTGSTRSSNLESLRAQCNAGNCDARDYQTLAALEKQAETKGALARLQAQCDAGNCDARDLRTLEELRKQAAQEPTNRYGTGAPCTGSLCNKDGNNNPDTTGSVNRDTGSNNPLSKMMPLLANLLKGLLQPKPPQAPSRACPTDPQQYQQYQQQYQQELQQYNFQLQQYNYQQQLNNAYGIGQSNMIPPVQPVPCTPSTGQQCQSQPAQPPAQNCTAGTWKPTQNGACITGWQCSTSSGGTASLSCEPKIADVGMTLAISYSCSAGTAVGGGFTASTSPSGTATTTIAAPPAGKNTATYTLTCNNNGATTGAQCAIQVAVPSIILVANPKTVASGETSIIGWVTTGMKSCVASSPNDSDFTTRNSSNTSVSGTASTSPITATRDYTLNCQTIGGGTRAATTTVTKL